MNISLRNIDRNYLRAFEGFKVTVMAPTLDLPIGKAMKKVRKAIQEGVPLDDNMHTKSFLSGENHTRNEGFK
ncbi:hypothetical protein CW706_05550 [Candidatus Bathyarchaeota archaeon]|nr:MAG: hypothetical protein CW706_05550 [Candidatus Bathyarchaeota archaeon]